MASNFASAPGVSSPTPDSSPSDLVGEATIRRSLVRIPSAQKKLLTGHESWASLLSRRANGFLNVPPDVLDQVKDAYIRRKKLAGSGHVVESSGHPEDDTSAPEPSGSQSSLPLHVQKEDGDGGDEDGDDDDDDTDEQLSWPASPERQLIPPSVHTEEQSQPFLTQLPEKSPPQPTVVTSPPGHPKLPEFPQSSQGHEDELEVEVPAALTYIPMPINKSALPISILATPPSAQVVPCTFEQSTQGGSTAAPKSSDLQRKPKSKPHVYKSVPQLYPGPKQGTALSHLNINAGSNKATTALGHQAGAESSLTTNDTSSSIVPSTTDDRKIESEQHIEACIVKPGQKLTHGANLSSDNLNSPSAPGLSSPMEMQPAPLHAHHSPEETASKPKSVVRPAVASKSWEAPFVHYTVTYPDYDGTILDFITACIYIQLQYRRIRTSLYDDFIRAWVAGYLPYVKECDEAEPPRKALRAIEWYNEIDDDPLYTSRVITRQNLQSILNFYPRELEIARASLGAYSSQGSSQHSDVNNFSVPYAQKSHDLEYPRHPQQSKGKEPMRKTVKTAEMEVETSMVSPIPLQRLRPSATNKQMSLHKSFGGIDARPAQREGLTRSLSESTMHKKRFATSELRSEGTKRVSLGLTPATHSRMWSDSGSTVSNHSERSKAAAQTPVIPGSSKRRESTKAIEDPEERRRRKLAKHFKKRFSGGRDSITSSAPIYNTPTSGQKQ
ncbi:hypothetical protein F5Y07DRAFT_384534 [Xylaria sp. FL0933]|nr:hypothetical protein F5Y07DRAFT_384534 [Xylaria sp. FL0933]